MSHVIIDTSEGDARVVCDEYGDPLVFSSAEDADAFRVVQCDLRRSYVLPHLPRRLSHRWMFWWRWKRKLRK